MPSSSIADLTAQLREAKVEGSDGDSSDDEGMLASVRYRLYPSRRGSKKKTKKKKRKSNLAQKLLEEAVRAMMDESAGAADAMRAYLAAGQSPIGGVLVGDTELPLLHVAALYGNLPVVSVLIE